MMWSAFCSAPHLQFKYRARPHLFMNEQKSLSLTQDALGKLIPRGLVLTMIMKAWIADTVKEYSVFHFVFVHWVVWMLISTRLSSDHCVACANGHLNFSLYLLSVIHVTDNAKGSDGHNQL